IDHGNGYSTTYAHMSVFAVSPGERVSQGEMIGRIGMTGLTTGPHNHFIVRRNGVPINPLSVLP
ncbi:MAG: M23 family metallopeptidase, partial [Dehalococcoidia bacterium]|nr:M23 family metallopeptidase [Dehalococcoidia bacterium]